MGTLTLEDSITVGGSYTGLLVLKVWGSTSNVHLLQSTIHGTQVEFTGQLTGDCSHFLVVRAVVTSLQSTASRAILRLTTDDKSRVFPMPTQDVDGLCKVVEICAGLGFLGHGMQYAGFQTVLRVDWSKPISDLAQQLDGVPSCVADIAEDTTLIPICEIGKGSGTLAAGVSCQPYSRLGDQKQQHDSRADTLPNTLRIAHLTRKQIVILECVEGAMHCKWLQETLLKFARETGFKLKQGLLHLQQVWPARRTRWWCLLTHPSLGEVHWHPFPSFNPQPTLACLVEKFLQITIEHMAQLELDTYELGKWGVQGLSKNEMHMDQPMATSLHSCANHLIACPCGCRKHPMNDGRLQRDGMHGLLVSMNMMIKAHDIIYPKMRHIHPDELSLFNGVRPGQNWGANLRLALCGLGQLASPLQSGWIASTIKAHLYAINLVQEQPSTPIQNTQKMMQDLLGDRDKVFGPQQHPQAVAFAEAVSKMTHPIVNPPDDIQQVPSQFPEMNPKESAKEESFAKLSQESLDDLDQAILAVGAEVRQKDTQAFATGAVPGFAVKRKNVEDGDTTIKRQCVDPSVVAPQTHPFQTDTKVDTSGNGMEAVKEGGPCPSDRWCPNSGRTSDSSRKDFASKGSRSCSHGCNGHPSFGSHQSATGPSFAA